MVLYLLIALGGALGSVARFGLSGLIVVEKVRVIHNRGDATPGPTVTRETA